MARESVTVIEIVAQLTDDTQSGASSATRNVNKLEQAMKKAQQEFQRMKGMSKLEIAMRLKDLASKGLQSIANAGKKIAGKVWHVTMKLKDLVTAPFRGIMRLIANPIVAMAGVAGITLGISDTINTFKDFEQGMANVKAILRGTDEDMAALTATAKELGASTVFSATQAAEAMEYLAMAGWKTEEITKGMPGLLSLAAAGSVDLATAADVVSSALAQFNMDASESTRVADVLAAVATNSKTDVQGLGDSLKMVGTQAGSLGYSIEDTALALGLMGNAGIDASSAGTALRSSLARMAKQEGMTTEESNAVSDAMKKVGVSLTDNEGKSKSLVQVMKELRAGFQGMTEVEKAATATNLAGMYAQSGLLAIVNASDEKFNQLASAIENAQGAAEEMAKTKMDTLAGAMEELSGATEDVKIAIGERLQPHLKDFINWLTGKMPAIKMAAMGAMDFLDAKIKQVKEAIGNMVNSPEWQNAETLWDKIKVAWNKLIAEPFDQWWNSTGKAWLAGKAEGIGRGLGGALKAGILTLLGVDASDALTDGVSIGKSFMEGFLEGFDGKKVAEAIWSAIKGIFSDAATLMPGGEEASDTAGLSAAALAVGGYKVGKPIYSVGKGVVKGSKALYNLFTGGAKAAATSADDVVRAAAKTGGLAGKAIPILGGVISLAEMGWDAYKGVGKAEEWTGSDSLGNKIASEAGAFLGGQGGGVLDKDTSALNKAGNVAGGALKGAGIGAAIGAALSAIGGKNIAKFFSTVGGAIGGFFTKTLPGFFSKIWSGISKFFTQTIPKALSNVGNAIKGFFTETIPQKWNELWTGVGNFFTQTIPYALGYAVGKIEIFFTETVPKFFGDLWNGITNFFTQTIPNAISAVGSALSTFFTQTVPNFFSGLWNGITTFFTETIPYALSAVGEALGIFFTETVPNFFVGLWEGIKTFFTETIPNALSTIGDALKTFFTETIPNFFSGLWNGITTFFTEEIPKAAAAIGNGIKSFFTETIPNFFKGLWNSIAGAFGAGYSDATESHAEGGIMTRPHYGLVAEDGAEAIIPLSPGRRGRGLALWEKAGQMLGAKPYAEGGIVTSVPAQSGAGGGVVVPVTIENVTFEINVEGGETPDPQSIVQMIRENVTNMTDEIAYQIAMSLQQVFSNMPKAAVGV
ncbi:MAG: phage tail tape measure protein [Clostridium sp.]|jgi:TP901 family phage tail tape measure protein|nr:phage tail tape measure protein [Clostridium sp.]